MDAVDGWMDGSSRAGGRARRREYIQTYRVQVAGAQKTPAALWVSCCQNFKCSRQGRRRPLTASSLLLPTNSHPAENLV